MEAPRNIGRYQIESELGRGAMGVVFKARDPVVERVVAIKTIPLGLEGSEVLVSRLQSEAKSVGQLEHPNIVTLYDAGEVEGVFYMAMQFVQGETLRDRMNRQRWFPLHEIQKLLRQICAALDYAHRHGVIHRDVKPSNIMIASGDVVKLTDFGIAKIVGTETTTPGMIMGSPSYMSPEQALGRPLDGRSDLFSLGSILYELITGEPAFPGTNVSTIIYRIVHESPSALTAFRPGLHPALEAIVLKALAKQPEQRFQSCEELATAVEDCSQGAPAEVIRDAGTVLPVGELPSGPSASSILNLASSPIAPTPAPPAVVTPASSRHGLVWTAGGLGALLLLLAGIFAFVNSNRTAPPRSAVTSNSTQPAGSLPAKTPEPSATDLRHAAVAPAPVTSRRVAPTPRASVSAAIPKLEVPVIASDRPASNRSDPTLMQVAPAETTAAPSHAEVAGPPSQSEPTTAQGYVLKGDLAFQQSQYQDALAAYTKAHEMNPNNREVRRKISVVLTLLGRAEEARQYK